MSVYVEMLVPYSFSDLSCKRKAIDELMLIKNKFASFFHLSECFIFDIEDYDETEFDSDNRYRLNLPIQDLDIELGNGFLMIEGAWNYSQYFYATDGNSWLRYMHFDVLRALGYREAYVMDEYHGSNNIYSGNKEFGCYNMSFDVWKAENPNPPVLPLSVLHDSKANVRPEIESVYLDKFEDCKLRLMTLEKKFPQYKILTIANFSGSFILVLYENKPIIIDEKSGKTLDCGYIQGINNRFNSAGFEIYRDTESAFFSFDGIQRTPFRKGSFSWHWEKGCALIIEVLDDNTGEVIYTKPL